MMNHRQVIGVLTIFILLGIGCKKKSDDTPIPFLGITVYDDFKTHPDTFIFKASATIPCSFVWNFADGSLPDQGDSVMHIFNYGYYKITLKGTSQSGKTATTISGINASPYKKAKIISLTLQSWPALRSDGTTWDTDGTSPDLYCELINGNNIGYTTVAANPISGSSINFNFSSPLSVTQFDKTLTIKLYNQNTLPVEDDLMYTLNIDDNVTELMTQQLPYAQSKNFASDKITGTIYLIWE
jgi:hypothetical protein